MKTRKKRKKRLGNSVSGHIRRMASGKPVKVKGYKRKSKPKARTGIHKAFKRKFEVTYYQDDQGRLVSKRKYRML